MNTFNATVIEGVVRYVGYILDRITAKDQAGRRLSINSYDVVDSNSSQISELIAEGKSEVFTILFKIDVAREDGVTFVLETPLQVPKMVNNLFVIEGKTRIATSTFSNDWICRIYEGSIVFDREKVVKWKFPNGIQPHFSPKYMWIECFDADGNPYTIDAYSENFETYKDMLRLTDEQRKKLQVKLDVDYVGEYITSDLVKALFELGPDRYNDSVIDRRIVSIENDIVRHLWIPTNRRDAIVNISNRFFSTGDIVLDPVQHILNRYLRTAKTKYVEIPNNVNPLVYDSLKYKVVFPGYLAYNESFSDLIDPANTPENGNVNIINELNVCVSQEGENLFIYCYDFKSRRKVKLPYLDYLNKRVLKCEYVDYESMEVKPSEVYEYKLRLKTYKVNSLDEVAIDLIEPAPDEKLSLTSRRIPLINMSDSVRVAMGNGMIRQAIETEAVEPRLVDSGNDNTDYIMSSNLVTYPGSNEGVVTRIEGNQIFIQDEITKAPIPITIPSPTVGANKATLTFDPTVKVGDKVTPNQVVVAPGTMKGGTYNLGHNALCVYMNYLGYTFEDGVVVSQSYANKCTHYSVKEVQTRLGSRDTLRYIRKIGSRVKSRDILASVQTQLQANRNLRKALEDKDIATGAIGLTTNQNNTLTPNNTDEGYVVDVQVFFKPGYKEGLSDYTMKIIDDYIHDKSKSSDYDFIPDKYKNLNVTAPDEFKGNDLAIIVYKIVCVNRMKIGDKSSNSYGSKGIISLILPDECMPRIDLDGNGNGPVADIIMNPGAVIARKNVSQLYELALTKCIHAIYEKVGQLLSEDKVSEAKQFTTEFYKDKFTKMTDDEFKKVHAEGITNFKLIVGSYAKIDYPTVTKWMSDLGVEESNYVYVPDVVIYDSPTGTKACTPEYAKEHGIQGKYYELGFTEQPIVTGWSYMYKLYHSADYSGKVTSSAHMKGDPILGRGLRRDGGQKIGEMELWALMSYNMTDLVTKGNKEIHDNENLFLNELLLSGFVLTDQMGLPYGTEYRTKVRELKRQREQEE